MPRSIWNGTISFGLVTVPIKLFSAIESKGVHFHEAHARDGARIQHRRICPREGREVPYEEIVKGYQLGEGEYVVLTKDEIKAAAGPRTKIVELEDFVDAGEIDPVFYRQTYFLGSREGGQDAYRLLYEALRRSKRAGIGRWTYHDREYLVAVRVVDRVLALHTMRFHDEVVSGSELDLPAPQEAPSQREVEMATQLVGMLHDDFKPESYKDSYREAVLELIRRKAAGEEIERAEEEQPEEAPDLLAALRASLGDTSKAGARG